MALQATGPIKYSEIEAEFGRSYSAIGENWSRVFGPDYDDSYFQIFNSNNGWRAALYVNNATDEVYATYIDDVSYGFGTLGRQYGRPMETGISLIWDFN